jgi:D-arabinonate dehydratase
MRIEAIEVIPLDMKLDEAFYGGTYVVTARPTLIARVHLENGIVGETYGGDECHTQAEIVKVAREILVPLLVGKDVRDAVGLWERMFSEPIDLGNRSLHQLDMHPRGIIAQAISVLDNALWDARGRLYRTPLYRLLGGCRDKVPVIAIGGYAAPSGVDPLNALTREVETIVSQGVYGMKLKVGRMGMALDIERVRTARKAGGPDFVIVVDANQRWSPSEAATFCEALDRADLNVRWMEEPVAWWDQTDGLRFLQSRTRIPITVGQGEITGRACRDLITKAGVNILNVDCTLCGGITEWTRIANFAYLSNVEMAHHEEPQVAIHLLAAHPMATYVEIFLNPKRDPLVWSLPVGFPRISNGYMEVPQGDGIGIALNDAVIAKYRVG